MRLRSEDTSADQRYVTVTFDMTWEAAVEGSWGARANQGLCALESRDVKLLVRDAAAVHF